MNRNYQSPSLVCHPAEYRICIMGRMDPERGEYLGGMSVSIRQEIGRRAITELSGQLPDQAALMGVLQQLYISNIPIISVECLTPDICLEQP